ncbi:LLM class flavin-dependent oxidoreductase [Allorhizocola rhizosphaerae]|uniref:LLM class flavin-dependent oxidoreductase n=1 Tax=Allorhizocola rhizosphaerae TaxID=1872709 RepID=UPI000E3BA660|nr:LLM class flavin-dependent oxidoreductase [Allorhizocola rhizosphaerae]
MKITLFEQAAYRYLPPDFAEHHDSVCDTPYSLVTHDGMYSSMRNFLDELMFGARSGFDGIAVTEHAQSSYDLMPNPNVVAGILAYQTEQEELDVAIFPMGRSLGKTREPVRVAEEYSMLDVISGGRLVAGFPVGLSYDASLNNGIPPIDVRGRFNENLDLVLRSWQDPKPFAFNGRYSQYPQVNIWPRPLQQPPPVWLTGVGNPATMQLILKRGFGFTFFGFAGSKLTAQRIFPRFWELADEAGLEHNPYQVGFLQHIAVAETDERAEREYAEHVEYAFHTGLGAIPPQMLALPGGIDIRGVQALLRDPSDFGIYWQMRQASLRDLIDSGTVIIGSPETVADQLTDLCRQHRIGNLHALLGFGSMPRELAMRNIKLFADEVAPRLRNLWQGSGFEHHWWPERLGGTLRRNLGEKVSA